MTISVVIAAYNERENIEPLTRRIAAVMSDLTSSWELIYVIEGTDGTKEIVERLQREIPQISLLYAERPSGLGAAFRRGFAAVSPSSRFVVTMDADLNHSPESIPALLDAAAGADLVVGSRFVTGGRITGVPAWKRFLSYAMNIVMHVLFGTSARDKTSGFRVYRREVLAQLEFRNDDFAFLPELLIRAEKAGFRVVETPIHFLYRVAGKSKMDIRTTIFSYLRLLQSRFDRWSVIAAWTIAAGVLIRILLAFPVFAYPNDGDAMLTALAAQLVLAGEWPVFTSGVRIGALEAYLAAPLVAVLGSTRTAMRLLPLACGAAFLVTYLLLVREISSRRVAAVALMFVAFAPSNFMHWTTMPVAYSSTLLLGTLSLLFAFRLRARSSRARAAGWGLSAGLGWWCSIQTLQTLVAGAAWWLLRRRRPPVAIVASAAVAFVIGAAPWIGWNVIHPLGTFARDYATMPVTDVSTALENGWHVVTRGVPDLLLGDDTRSTPVAAQRFLRVPVALIYAGALLWTAMALVRRRSEVPPGTIVLAMVAVIGCVLPMLTAAGSQRVLLTRYLLFVFLVFPLLLAFLVRAVSKRSVLAGCAIAALVIFFNVAGYALPGTAPRREWRERLVADDAVLNTLRARGVTLALGDFWDVYPMTYLSAGEIIGFCRPGDDILGFGRGAGPGMKWAFLTPRLDLAQAAKERSSAGGEIVPLGGRYLFLPAAGQIARAEDAESLLGQMLSGVHGGTGP